MLYNFAVQNRIKIWEQSKGQKSCLAMPTGKHWKAILYFDTDLFEYTRLWLLPLKWVVSQSQGWHWKSSALSGNHGDSSVVLRACMYLFHATEVLNKQQSWKDAEELKLPSQNQSAKAGNGLQAGILPHTADRQHWSRGLASGQVLLKILFPKLLEYINFFFSLSSGNWMVTGYNLIYM